MYLLDGYLYFITPICQVFTTIKYIPIVTKPNLNVNLKTIIMTNIAHPVTIIPIVTLKKV